VKKNPGLTNDAKDDDYCPICYTSGIGDAPSIKPECGDICHVDCLFNRLKKCWSGPRITFAFCECPTYRKWVNAPQNPEVAAEMKKVKDIFEDIRKKSMDRLKYEGLGQTFTLSDYMILKIDSIISLKNMHLLVSPITYATSVRSLTLEV
jgi:hypothetical protein